MLIESHMLALKIKQPGSFPGMGPGPWCMIPSTPSSNLGRSGDEPDGPTTTIYNNQQQ